MAVNLAPTAWMPVVDANGDPLVGALLFTYAVDSTTKQATYTTSAGDVAHANPIVLNVRGVPDDEIWLTDGLTYKFVLAPSTDSDPPVAAIRTANNIDGINDTGAITVSQWQASGLTPTFVSATSFTLVGDQTSEFHVGRRVKSTVTGGTAYSRITVSSFSSVTTVTVVNDSTTLDSGLSAVEYGLLTTTNPAIPVITAGVVPDNLITLAMMAGITKGKLISGDASNNPQYETYQKWETENNSGDLTSGTTHIITGIHSSATKIEMICTNMQTATSNGGMNVVVGHGATPTYLTDAGDYFGTINFTSSAADSKEDWNTFANCGQVVSTNDRASATIVFDKMNDGSNDTWQIRTSGAYDTGSNNALFGGGGQVKGASLTAALTAIKITLSAGTWAGAYITTKIYGNSEV